MVDEFQESDPGQRKLLDLLSGPDLVITYDADSAVGRFRGADPDGLKEVVDAVSVPVQAVGGLSLEQAIACPSYGAPLVVIGAPLAIDADSFSRGAGNVEEVLRKICEAVHGFGDVKVKNER